MRKILEILLGRVGHVEYRCGMNVVDGRISNNSILVPYSFIIFNDFS